MYGVKILNQVGVYERKEDAEAAAIVRNACKNALFSEDIMDMILEKSVGFEELNPEDKIEDVCEHFSYMAFEMVQGVVLPVRKTVRLEMVG